MLHSTTLLLMNGEQLFVRTAGCSGLFARFHRPDYIIEAN